jgi:iron only hydrogenase large subunit-like protein
LFKSISVKAILDTSSSRDLSLIEVRDEFISCYQKIQSCSGQEAEANLPMIQSACPVEMFAQNMAYGYLHKAVWVLKIL